MRQVIYQSLSTRGSAVGDAPAILRGARPFNGMNGLSGLLCVVADRFLQVVEGPDDSVDEVMRRIRSDPRHHRIEVLADRAVPARAFADWAMAYRDEGHPADLLDEHLRVMVRGAPAEIGERFTRFLHDEAGTARPAG